ncbi:OmpA family protein [Nesterenkonia muleiensis]|uniref:OmpA family protein n=1 Tax=Nesterenkonia muleiensis TaxID=2282648 RepID=UPI000E7613BB|nr:OmpA family protein [Nesterenkonia muleiensis]
MNTSAPIKTTAAMAVVLALAACAPEDAAEFDDGPPTAPVNADGETGSEESGGQAEQESEPEPAGSGTGDEADGESVSATATFIPHYSGPNQEVTMETRVGPVVRDGDLAVLPMEFDYQEGEEGIATMDFLFGLVGITDGSVDGGQVRLIDPDQMTVAEVARLEQGEGPIAVESAASGDGFGDRAEPGETLDWVGVFDAPESDTVSILLPHFGMVSGVPVIEGDLEEANTTGEPIDYTDVVGQSHDLITWRDTPEYSIEIEGEETTVSLPSDVLFDVDSSDLSSEADEALQAAAQEMAGTEGGELRIVGHTDNVLDEEYNQQLSEERAEAVHQRLQDLVDLDAFDEVSVTGESFREPIADNDSEEGRAMNRRVELHFTTVTHSEEQTVEGELPEPQGPVASADEELHLSYEGDLLQEYNDDVILSVDSLERHDGFVVAGIRAETTVDDGDISWPFIRGTGGIHRAGVSQVNSVDLPYLVAGDQWIEPLRYFVTDVEIDEENPEETEFDGADYRRLSDVLFGVYYSYNEGDSAVAYLVYPDIGADELTLESPGEYEGTDWLLQVVGVNPWRFEDVPVTDAGSDEGEQDAAAE